MSSGKSASCLEMAFALNMVNHGNMVMPATLLELHVLTKVIKIKKPRKGQKEAIRITNEINT